MTFCPHNKEKTYNDNKNFRNNSFNCSNCLTKQLIKGNYIFTGYCEKQTQKWHGNYLTCNTTSDIDQISFICSYNKCNKISFNQLNGKPRYNIASIGEKDLEILQVLTNHNQPELHQLIKEYFLSVLLKHNSSATLLARKMLIYFAYIIGCKSK